MLPKGVLRVDCLSVEIARAGLSVVAVLKAKFSLLGIPRENVLTICAKGIPSIE